MATGKKKAIKMPTGESAKKLSPTAKKIKKDFKTTGSAAGAAAGKFRETLKKLPKVESAPGKKGYSMDQIGGAYGKATSSLKKKGK